MIVLNPTVHHSVARLIENHASGLVVSQATSWTPKFARSSVRSPDWLLSSHHHNRPTTPMPSVHGAKKIARNTFRPGNLPLTSTASPSPAATSVGVLMSTNRRVFQTPFQKIGKW